MEWISTERRDGLYAAADGLRSAEPSRVISAFRDVAAISDYFVIETAPPGDGWRPLTELFTDSGALTERVTGVADRLGTDEPGVAASILFQGMAARLWSPALGAAVAHDLLPDLDPGHLHWRSVNTGPLPLRAASPTGWVVGDPGRVGAFLYESVVEGLLEPLVAAVGRTTRIAPGLLWGNAASALAGTVHAIARERPGLTDASAALGRDLLARGVLRGTGELLEPDPGRHFFVRRSCCLYYRVPGGGKCGDCALLDPGTRLAQGKGAP